ncbi:MAG: hypothetical protein DWQ53_09860 [Microcystis flos-aquae DF17]|nr:MAG: hypothetical protein DWQ53_09860 [Microcystis flos-aquae DF17]
MGHNPRYAYWTRDQWRGHAPDLGAMKRRGWTVTARCGECRLEMAADLDRIIAIKGFSWSPWGKSAPCRRLNCPGRMRLRAYAPGPNEFIVI